MSGIYVHIPFCNKVCYYCDFHFTVSLKRKDEVLQSILTELKTRKDYLTDKKIETLYIGGGTPSILTGNELSNIFNEILLHYQVEKDAEITLEANPNDLSEEYLKELKDKTPVNRLSIGIQSFDDNDLKFLNRRHTSLQAYKSIEQAQITGFKNITIDLLYGIPKSDNNIWTDNLHRAFSLGVNHISAYHLTIEPKTVFAHYIKKGTLKTVDEKISNEQYVLLTELMRGNGYIQYEISNFSKPGFISKHNSNYWKGEEYLGIGPSAHSYNKNSRRWNTKLHEKYIHALNKKTEDYYETEFLDIITKYNELIITRLRTIWGVDKKKLSKEFPEYLVQHFSKKTEQFTESGDLIYEGDKIILSPGGMLRSDYIFTEFIYTES